MRALRVVMSMVLSGELGNVVLRLLDGRCADPPL